MHVPTGGILPWYQSITHHTRQSNVFFYKTLLSLSALRQIGKERTRHIGHKHDLALVSAKVLVSTIHILRTLTPIFVFHQHSLNAPWSASVCRGALDCVSVQYWSTGSPQWVANNLKRGRPRENLNPTVLFIHVPKKIRTMLLFSHVQQHDFAQWLIAAIICTFIYWDVGWNLG